jgi:hypothetical protein
MPDKPGPETLIALAMGLPVTAEQMEALVAHAEAWKAERADLGSLSEKLDVEHRTGGVLVEQLAEAKKRLELLEQDRKWWQENAIKRSKRAAERKSRLPPRGTKPT